MESNMDFAKSSRCQNLSRAEDRQTPPRSRRGTKLRDILMSDKPTVSYDGSGSGSIRNWDRNTFKALEKQQSQVTERKFSKEDELVRYMSKLPSYLEKGKNIQEKTFNVGVLDWARLEKWKGDNRLMPQKNAWYPPASSSSSVISTDVSSTLSGGGPSCSPSRHRQHHLPLRSHLEASPKQNCGPDASKSCSSPFSGCSPARPSTYKLIPHSHHPKAYLWECNSRKSNLSGGFTGKFQECSEFTDNKLNTQRKLFTTDQASLDVPSESMPQRCVSEAEVGKSSVLDNEMKSTWNGKVKVSNNEPKVEVVGMKECYRAVPGEDCSERKEAVLLLPKDQSQTNFSEVLCTTDDICTSSESGKKSISGETISEGVRSSHPCSLLSRDEIRKHSETRGLCSIKEQGVKVSPHSMKMQFSPFRSGNAVEAKPVPVIRSSSVAKPSVGYDTTSGSESATKTRNPSPIRRLGLGMARIIRSASSRDNSPQRKSVSSSERAAASVSSHSLSNDKIHANNRSRSSPLRRLLDPLLKPKDPPHCLQATEQLKRDSKSIVEPCKPSDERFRLPNIQSVKVKSGFDAIRMNNTDGCRRNNCGSSSLQALLQVAVKNGLPLFTFAVDNNSDILAATLRKASAPGKDQTCWIYTFFTIHEAKRKSRIWSNQGLKGNEHGYVPNVVAQMRTSDLQIPGKKSMNYDIVREFALFAVDVGQLELNATEFHPTNELAAIVVKLQRKAKSNPTRDEQPSNDRDDLARSTHTCERVQLRECRQSNFDDDSRNGSYVSHDVLSTTVILPGGVHTVPSNGAVSTLTQRWRSGGSCDCGGWDLGCQLRIYANLNEPEKKWSSSETSARDEFKLFGQVAQESRPVLSFAPFKDRIYSVEFDSSISLVQAFATCVAALECGRPDGLLEERIPGLMIPDELAQTKAMGQNPVEAAARYVSYPPHSPVGRV